MYNKVFTPRYPEGWKDRPDKTTPVDALALNGYDSAIQSVEEELVKSHSTFATAAQAACALWLSINPMTYVMTLQLLNKAGQALDSKEIDFPLESMVIGGDYADGQLTLTLQNGTTLPPIDVSSIVQGLVKETFKIAGIDMKDDITAAELAEALSLKAVATTGRYEDLKGRLIPDGVTITQDADGTIHAVGGGGGGGSGGNSGSFVTKVMRRGEILQNKLPCPLEAAVVRKALQNKLQCRFGAAAAASQKEE